MLPLSLSDFKLTSTIHETLGFKIDEDNVKTIIVKDGKTKETYLNVNPPRLRSMQLAVSPSLFGMMLLSVDYWSIQYLFFSRTRNWNAC